MSLQALQCFFTSLPACRLQHVQYCDVSLDGALFSVFSAMTAVTHAAIHKFNQPMTTILWESFFTYLFLWTRLPTFEKTPPSAYTSTFPWCTDQDKVPVPKHAVIECFCHLGAAQQDVTATVTHYHFIQLIWLIS